MRIRNLAAMGLLAGIAALAGGVGAATFTVTTTADTPGGVCDVASCTLREAIAAANTNPGADDIDLPAGNYVLALGQLDISDDLTVTGVAPVGNSVINGNASSRVIEIDPLGLGGLTVDLVDLFVINGNSSGSGGCIRNPALNTLALTDCFVSACTATIFGGSGGGIFNSGTLTITGTVPGSAGVDQGQALGGSGGGIANTGTATLNNSSVVLNEAIQGSGILNFGTLTINNSLIAQNTSGAGFGAIEQISGILTITDSTLRDHGSGSSVIRLLGGTGTIVNTTIRGNLPTGIDVVAPFEDTSTSLTVVNSTVSGNGGTGVSATSSGLLSARVGISHSTITGNATGVSSDVTVGLPHSIVALAHSIVAGNSVENCSGPVTSLGYNLDDDGTCSFTASSDLSNVPDAGLGPLDDYGGPTETHALLPGSPAIDAGRGTDQRGESFFDGDGDMVIAPDVGAYEFLPELSPGSSLLSGIALLALLARRRRHRSA